MLEFAPFLVPITLFVVIGAAIILRGPIGKALADRIAGRRAGAGSADAEALRAAVDDVHHRVAELEERMDFTERMLAQARQRDHLPGA